ncbi:type II toxin-antitoxin system HicA family toxin [Moorena producens]|uniref:type II toxin-antitoxin system HicA family toxin n=1 Tax=Moorena producens TaxID=1155739 RepID=UPI0009F2A83C|nr:type II toxin-antitoxin system HicA family toxin [Moorena producens]
MGKYEKLLQKILTGTSDKNIKFSELCQLLKKLGFDERIRGDHYIFTKDNVEEIINIQPYWNQSQSLSS